MAIDYHKAWRSGFRDCIRPLLAIDATFLKGNYRGRLFLATGQDANNQIFPLGFGVAATENDESWGWFLEKLRDVIGPREDLVIIWSKQTSTTS